MKNLPQKDAGFSRLEGLNFEVIEIVHDLIKSDQRIHTTNFSAIFSYLFPSSSLVDFCGTSRAPERS